MDERDALLCQIRAALRCDVERPPEKGGKRDRGRAEARERNVKENRRRDGDDRDALSGMGLPLVLNWSRNFAIVLILRRGGNRRVVYEHYFRELRA